MTTKVIDLNVERIKKLKEARERIRVTRDHFDRAKLGVERGLGLNGAAMKEWYFYIEGACVECNRETWVGVVDIYKILVEISKRYEDLFENADRELYEAQVLASKRGSKRGGKNLPLTPLLKVYNGQHSLLGNNVELVLPSEDLPQIKRPSQKESSTAE